MKTTRTVALDEFDFKILDLVQKDNSLPLRAISEAVNLSSAAVQRRLQVLRQSGVIRGEVALLDPNLVGKVITLIVEVHLEKTGTKAMAEIRKKFAIPEVQQCYYVTGSADFVLILHVSSMEEFKGISDRLFYSNKNVKWFQTLVVLETIKAGTQVPLP